MSLLSRRKGRAWEQEVARILRPLFGDGVRRGWQSRSGKDASDIEGTPYHIECKHGKAVSVWAAMRQAVEASNGRMPVVVAKLDRSEPLVVMRLSDWVREQEERLPKAVVNALSKEEQA